MDYTKVLESIKPSLLDEKKICSSKDEVIKSILSSAKENNLDVVVTPGGSTAKGTYLKGDFDIDIFVRFKFLNKPFSNSLELLLSNFATKQNIVIERIHGSRDYFTFSYRGLFFEIVPVKFVESLEGVENITDMSPLHVQWIDKFITPTLRDDIRLAKQFCKSALVYGAESYINGISGHVLDISIIYYGSFDKWVRAVSRWSGVTVIDINKEHDDVFTSLNQSKLVSPLIVVDPVDKNRNAAAALSMEKYYLLINRCKKFLINPTQDFFIIPSFDLDALKKKKKVDESLFLLKVSPQIGKRDVIATRILKVFEFLNRHLQLHNFTVCGANWFYGEEDSYLFYFLKKETLDLEILREGPPLILSDDVKRFQEVHEKTFIQNDKICTFMKRDFIDAYDCFTHLIKSSYVQERVTSTSSKKYG